MDPRLYQIAALSGLLVYGLFWLKFDLSLAQALLSLGGALGTQWLCSRWRHIAFDPKSALISGLSLCLLLRTIHALARRAGGGHRHRQQVRRCA